MPLALAVPALISAGGSLASGLLGSHAAHSAAAIQAANAGKVAQMATDAGNKASAGVTAAGTKAATGVTDAASAATARADAAAPQAIKAVSDATTGANQFLNTGYNAEQTALQPYLTAGAQGTADLAQAMGTGGDLSKQFNFGTGDLQNDPGYQFTMNEAMKAIQRSAAAHGQLQGGGTLKSLAQYSTGLASTHFNDAYQRALQTFQTNRNNRFQGLTALSGIGQNAVNQFGSATRNYGNQASANTLNRGLYEGNTVRDTAQYGGNMGFQGANAAGQFGLTSANDAGRFGMEATDIAGRALTGGANAQAAGTVGAANAWANTIGGLAKAGQSAYSAFNDPDQGSAPNFQLPTPNYGLGTFGTPPTITPSAQPLPSYLQQAALPPPSSAASQFFPAGAY